jgi:hypothetical protein
MARFALFNNASPAYQKEFASRENRLEGGAEIM